MSPTVRRPVFLVPERQAATAIHAALLGAAYRRRASVAIPWGDTETPNCAREGTALNVK
ncbi:hypothetical protein GCM10009826_01010 [Humibacillus xanthopallidus]